MEEKVGAAKPLGWLATLLCISFRPAQFFAGSPRLGTRVGPHGACLLGMIANAVGLQLTGELLSGTAEFSKLLAAGLAAALGAIPLLYVYTAVIYGAARLLGARLRFAATRDVLGYADLTGVWGLLPVVGLAATPWRWWVAIVALAKAHGIGWVRATLVYASPFVGTLVLTLGIRTFAYEAFKIPSEGMYPTLTAHDHLFVAKSAYGVFSKSLPKRGDLIVFLFPDPVSSNPPEDYVKRVIGLPGDVLFVEKGHTTLNGWLAPSCPLGTVDIPSPDGASRAEMFVEFLEDNAYLVVVEELEYTLPSKRYTVSAGEVYVLGDNRNNSFDSRAWNDGRGRGVPLANVSGRATLLWLPLDRFGVPLDAAPVLQGAHADLAPKLAACLEHPPSASARTPPAPRAGGI